MKSPTLVKHQSTSNPNLFFWAQGEDMGIGVSYIVMGQVNGAPQTEAFDEWFNEWHDANEIAVKLARGETIT